MDIGPQEIVIIVGVIALVSLLVWVKSKVNKNNAPQNNGTQKQ